MLSKSNPEIPYSYNNIKVVDMIPELSYLIDSFIRSEGILNRKNTSTDEEEKEYSFEVWSTAINFVYEYAYKIYCSRGIKIDRPSIWHGDDGCIDIEWETDYSGVLFTIHKNYMTGDFYSDITSKQQSCKGKFNVNDFDLDLLPIIKPQR